MAPCIFRDNVSPRHARQHHRAPLLLPPDPLTQGRPTRPSDTGSLHPGRRRPGDRRAVAVLQLAVVAVAVRLGVRPGVPVGLLVAVGGAGAALRLGLPIPDAVLAARRHVLLRGTQHSASEAMRSAKAVRRSQSASARCPQVTHREQYLQKD